MLTGELVRLRGLTERDLLVLHRWHNDPEVALWGTGAAPGFQPVGPEEVRRRYAPYLAGERRRREHVLLVEDLEGRPLGIADYSRVDEVARSAELGLTIGETDAWSRGYGSDAARLLIRFLFERMNLRRVQIHTWDGNERVLRTASRLGFVEEGRLRQAQVVLGEYRDTVVLGLLRNEFVPGVP